MRWPATSGTISRRRPTRTLPSVGTITVHDPFTGKPWQYQMPAGGRGYTRPPSLISLWSTAPFLLNNTVGQDAFEQDPSVDARMRVFQASIEQMLWPEKRDRDPVLGNTNRVIRSMSSIARRSAAPSPSPPAMCRRRCGRSRSRLHTLLPKLFGTDGGIVIGPFPKGLPVNLLANIQPLPESDRVLDRVRHVEDLVKLLVDLKLDLRRCLRARRTSRRSVQSAQDGVGSCWRSASARTSWSTAGTISAPAWSPGEPASGTATSAR